MIEKFLYKNGEKSHFLWLDGTCLILWVLWSEWSGRIFRGMEKDPSKFWPLLRFYIFWWTSVLKTFWNYSKGVILHCWSPVL